MNALGGIFARGLFKLGGQRFTSGLGGGERLAPMFAIGFAEACSFSARSTNEMLVVLRIARLQLCCGNVLLQLFAFLIACRHTLLQIGDCFGLFWLAARNARRRLRFVVLLLHAGSTAGAFSCC